MLDHMASMAGPFAALGPVDHIGVAVPSLEEALPFWRDVLGLPLAEIEDVADQKVRTAILPTGEGRVELLEPTAEDSPIAIFLAKKGPGIHHLALRVEGLEAKLAQLKAAGVKLIDEVPRLGAGGNRIAFLHPKATGGVLLELCEPLAGSLGH